MGGSGAGRNTLPAFCNLPPTQALESLQWLWNPKQLLLFLLLLLLLQVRWQPLRHCLTQAWPGQRAGCNLQQSAALNHPFG